MKDRNPASLFFWLAFYLRSIEVEVVSVGDDRRFDVPVSNEVLVQIFGSSLGLLVVVEQNGSKSIFTTLRVHAKDRTFLDVVEALEELSNLIVSSAIWHASDFHSHAVLISNCTKYKHE